MTERYPRNWPLPKVGEHWTEDGLRAIAKLPSEPGTLAYVLRDLFKELDMRRSEMNRDAWDKA